MQIPRREPTAADNILKERNIRHTMLKTMHIENAVSLYLLPSIDFL